MSARSRTSCRLQVELLEVRSLPSGLADAIEIALVLDSSPSTGVQAAKFLAKDAMPGAGLDLGAINLDRIPLTGGTPAPAAVLDPLAADLGRIFLALESSAPVMGRPLPGPDLRQMEERLDELARAYVAGLAALAVQPTPSPIVQGYSEIEPRNSVHLPPAAALIAAGPSATRLVDEVHGTAIPQSEPALLISDNGPAAGDAVGYVPPSDGTPDVVPSATPLDDVPPAWRDVFRDPLAGTPIGEAVATDLRALNAAAHDFFEHLANLAPEWSPETEWDECAWFAAGAALAAGGVHLARRSRSRNAAPTGRPSSDEWEEVR